MANWLHSPRGTNDPLSSMFSYGSYPGYGVQNEAPTAIPVFDMQKSGTNYDPSSDILSSLSSFQPVQPNINPSQGNGGGFWESFGLGANATPEQIYAGANKMGTIGQMGNLAFQGIGTLGNLYMGMKGLSQAKKMFNAQKNLMNANYLASVKAFNNAERDKARGRQSTVDQSRLLAERKII